MIGESVKIRGGNSEMTTGATVPPYRFTLTYKGFFAGFVEGNLPPEDRAGSGEKQLSLKNGTMAYGTEFYKWLCSFKKRGEERRDFTVTLHDDEHHPIKGWLVHNGYPVRVGRLQLKVAGNLVTMDAIDMEYERIEEISPKSGES